MNKALLLENLCRIVAFSSRRYEIAILLNSMEEVVKFNKELTTLLDTVPVFLLPGIKKHTLRNINTDHGNIHIVNSADQLRSRTLTVIFKSSSLTEEKKEEYREVELVHTLITSALCIFEFDNN